MSRKVATLVYSKQAGSMARKAVLAYFADRANDDGTGIWAAKQRIADEIECSKQTVITTVKTLVAEGILREVGKRPNGNGYTVEYAMDLAVIEALPCSKRDDQEVQFLTGQDLDGSTSLTARGQAALPKPSLNRPIPQKTSSSSGKCAPSAAAERYHRLPSGWTPTKALPEKLRAKVAEWPPGKVDDELEALHRWAANASNDRGKGRKLNWDIAWENWLDRADNDWRSKNGSVRRDRGSAPRSNDGFLNAIRESGERRRAANC